MPQRQRWEEMDEIAVSDIGTIAAARVFPQDGQGPFIAVSRYARWLEAHPSTSDSAMEPRRRSDYMGFHFLRSSDRTSMRLW